MRIGVPLATFMLLGLLSGGCKDGSSRRSATVLPLDPPAHPPSLVPSLPWRSPVNHGSEARKNLQACQACHGQPGGPGSDPPFDVSVGALERGCESSSGCHLNGDFDHGHNPGTAHPALDPDDPDKQDLLHWYGESIVYLDGEGVERRHLISHHDAGNLEGACTPCHGATLEGGAGPACSDCHVTDVVASPSGCVSCHGARGGATADLIDAVGRGPELEGNAVHERFIAEVARGFHLAHEAIACEDRDSVEDCRTCHGTLVNVDRHHALLDDPELGLDCGDCHLEIPDPLTSEAEIVVFRDCGRCHDEPFPRELPCSG